MFLQQESTDLVVVIDTLPMIGLQNCGNLRVVGWRCSNHLGDLNLVSTHQPVLTSIFVLILPRAIVTIAWLTA